MLIEGKYIFWGFLCLLAQFWAWGEREERKQHLLKCNKNPERHWAQSSRPIHCIANPKAVPLGKSLCKTSVMWKQAPAKNVL